MAKPPRNGIGGQNRPRRPAAMVSATAHHQSPIGRAPTDFSKTEKAMFNAILAECDYLNNRSYRRWLIMTSRIAVRYEVLVRFFKKRAAELEKENPGEGEALAYLSNDESKRHPLAIELRSSEDSLRQNFTQLGMSMASQARIMSSVINSTKEAQERSTLAAKYFS